MLTFEIQIASIAIAIVVGVVSKICYDWLAINKKPSNGNKSVLDARNETRLIKIGDEVEWLKDAHAKTDQDGLPVWYVPRELTRIAKDNSERAIETNLILKDIKELLKQNGVLMQQVMREVQELKK